MAHGDLRKLDARTYKLTIAYDGTDFAGWQVQPEKETIQGCLQRAMRNLVGQQVNVIGSGRTDAGVHALAQVASCEVPWRDSPVRLVKALNAHLPDAIVVTHADEVAPGFHAIRDAVAKRYRYQLQIGGCRNPFQSRYRWHLHGEIDHAPMKLAADQFLGSHDFRGFQTSGSERKTTVREIRACELIHEAGPFADSRLMAVEIEGNGFLYNMVRTMVGSLIEVGRGKQPPEWISELLASGDRGRAGQTAPAHGLFLIRVDYPPQPPSE